MRRWSRRGRDAAAIGLCLALGACTYNAPVYPVAAPDPAATPDPAAAPAAPRQPLVLGLHLDEQLVGYRQRTMLPSGDAVVMPIGEAIAVQLEGACRRQFTQCPRLPAAPPAPAPEAVDLVLVPRLERASLLPGSFFGLWELALTLSFDLVTPSGALVASGRADGRGKPDPVVDLRWMSAPGGAMANAGRAVSAEMLRQVAETPEVRALLQRRVAGAR